MLKYEVVNADVKTQARIVAFKNGSSLRLFGMHWHKSTELLYCRHGKIEVQIHSTRYVLGEGDMIYINSNIPHETCSKEPNDVVMIQFKEPFYDRNQTIIDLNTKDHEISKSESDQLIALIEKADCIDRAKEPHYALMLNSVLFNLKHMLVTQFQKPIPDYNEESLNVVQSIESILHYIDQHYTEDMDVESLAVYAGYSLSYFSRKFKRIMGVSCVEYLQNRRLQHAVKLLANTDDSIQEIAMESGFKNIKAFRNVLHRSIGMTPSEYRGYVYHND